MLSTTILKWAQELLDTLEGKEEETPRDYWLEIKEELKYGNQDR